MKFTSLIKKILIEDINHLLNEDESNQSKLKFFYNKLVLPSEKTKKSVLPDISNQEENLKAFDVFKKIVLADPTTIVPEGFNPDSITDIDEMDKNVKVGKYVNWLFKIFVKPPQEITKDSSVLKEYQYYFVEDLLRLSNVLKTFHKNKQFLKDESKKNIDNVSSLDELYNLEVFTDKTNTTTEKLEDFRGRNVKVIGGVEAKKEYFTPGAEILKVGSDYTLVRIKEGGELGSKAAQYYGGYHKVEQGETNWCTSPPNSNYFNTYIKQGPLYIFLGNSPDTPPMSPNNKFTGNVGEITKLPSNRYQLHIPSGQFKDRKNGSNDFVAFLNKYPEFKEFFRQEYLVGATSKLDDKNKIDLGGTMINTYFQIYGNENNDIILEIIFNNLPTDIEDLEIYNSSKNSLALDIPETLGKLTNLESLALTNIVKTLPNSIGNIPTLRYLSLVENKFLESLPESIINLKKLSFINLEHSNPNIIIPPKLKAALEYEGDGFYSTKDNDEDDEY